MKPTEEQLKALDYHIAALQAWRDDPSVKLEILEGGRWKPHHTETIWEDKMELWWGLYRLAPTPQTRPMTWEEIPLGDIERVRWVGGGEALPLQNIDLAGKRLLIDCVYRKVGELSEFEYTENRDPRNATWHRFEVTE